MTAINEVIVKADRRGRLRYSERQRDELVNACKASGLSVRRFAELHGVKHQTLTNWLHQRKRASSLVPAGFHAPAPLLLVPAELEAPPAAAVAPMEVTLPGEARLVISAPAHIQLAAALIRELQAKRPC